MSFAAPTRMPTNNAEMANYGDDRKLIVTFTKEAVHMTAKSEVEGRQIYEDQDFITITTPGGKNDVKRRVKMEDDERGPSDINRFPRQWHAFQNQQHQIGEGLPVEQWPPLGKAQIMALKAAQIFSVEQFSKTPDSALGNINMLDARKYRDMAAAYLERADASAPIAKLSTENETLRAEMAAMKVQMEMLAANQKKKPGRPPGNHEED